MEIFAGSEAEQSQAFSYQDFPCEIRLNIHRYLGEKDSFNLGRSSSKEMGVYQESVLERLAGSLDLLLLSVCESIRSEESEGVIKSIQSPDHTYSPLSNHLMLEDSKQDSVITFNITKEDLKIMVLNEFKMSLLSESAFLKYMDSFFQKPANTVVLIYLNRFPTNKICLNLSQKGITYLPYSIKRLNDLRYLDLSSNWFKTLPYTIGSLIHLSGLNLACNDNLGSLPHTFLGLEKLNYLNTRGTGLPFDLQEIFAWPGIEERFMLRLRKELNKNKPFSEPNKSKCILS